MSRAVTIDAREAVPIVVNPRSLLRFITCGSVDDGKSTLIGRLLYEGSLIPDDQICALRAESKSRGARGDDVDYALLVDGLTAEREQGITIDVAYRYFATARRTFIVADTPGHEQYTRNMATGASTADLAVVLMDARKGVLPQTRRHSQILSMLGVRRVIVAVNKMDLVGFSQLAFEQIEANYRRFAEKLGFSHIICIPVSAAKGDNVVAPSLNTAWYRGCTVLGTLESIDIQDRGGETPFRMPVQRVNRPNSEFRGLSGLICGGRVRPGDRVLAQPSGFATRVARIVSDRGDLAEAVAGQSVTLTLAEEVDVARGDMLVGASAPASVADRIKGRLLWLADEHSADGPSYLIKVGTATAAARMGNPLGKLDVATGRVESAAADTPLRLNEIGVVSISIDRPVAFDPYRANRDTGGFILIDRVTNQTVAMGLIDDAAPGDAASGATDVRRRARDDLATADEKRRIAWIDHPHEQPWRSLTKALSWRMTGSMDTFLLALLFTGNARVSAAIGATEIITKVVLYYFHERIWTRIGLGRLSAKS
jgi:sulfate adenylyltransferase large subunit